jgi:cell division protein FtsB
MPTPSEPNMLLIAFNVVLALAGVFGGIVLRGLISDVKTLQAANVSLIEKLSLFATRQEVKADVAEVRSETREALAEIARSQAEGFNKVFDKLDEIKSQVANKADRSELR